MAAKLQLTYACSEAEMREAQSLSLRQQLGRGSRWRSSLVLFGVLAGLLGLVYLRIRTEVAPKDQVWFLALTVVLFVVFYFGQSYFRKQQDQSATKLEISERGVDFLRGDSRVSLLWSGFSQCLESPNLFVLVDRPKGMLLVLPKRTFPDEAAQHWFRNLAGQPQPVAGAMNRGPLPLPRTADGVVLRYQFGYRDYVNRTLASWRTKGIALLIVVFSIGVCLWQAAHPDPKAVNGPLMVLAIMLPFLAVMLAVALAAVSFLAWHSDKKYLQPQELALSSQGIEFVSQDSAGLLPWDTYKFYLENRWGFIIWNPRGQAWHMIPKRAFPAASDVERCRELLQTHLRRSCWFFI